jgi:hypothetical protein
VPVVSSCDVPFPHSFIVASSFRNSQDKYVLPCMLTDTPYSIITPHQSIPFPVSIRYILILSYLHLVVLGSLSS